MRIILIWLADGATRHGWPTVQLAAARRRAAIGLVAEGGVDCVGQSL